MRILLTDLLKYVFVCTIGLLLSVCSASPDADAPGNCKLSCDGAKIAGNNVRIRILSSSENAIASGCHGLTGGADYPTAIPVHFVVEQTNPSLPAGQNPPAGGETTPTPLVTNVGVPVSGVSFEPTIAGGLMSSTQTPDAPAKHMGIITSQDEWCTDSCGVGLVEVIPKCFGDNPNVVTLQIHSGQAAGVATITVSP